MVELRVAPRKLAEENHLVVSHRETALDVVETVAVKASSLNQAQQVSTLAIDTAIESKGLPSRIFGESTWSRTRFS